jgi:hypothetical protein
VGPHPFLGGAEGELLAVRISVEPRLLERLLDILAQVEFPISPQIYHQAALLYVYADGQERFEPTTSVEFPAYAGWLPAVERALMLRGFDPAALAVRGMLEELTEDCDTQPAPPGSPYRSVVWYRQAHGSPRGGTSG